MILVHKMVKDTCKQSICMCILEVCIYAEKVGERCYSVDFSKLHYNQNTMEALVSGHPWDIKKGYITGAGCLWECKNTEFVWQSRKTGFCEGSCK